MIIELGVVAAAAAVGGLLAARALRKKKEAEAKAPPRLEAPDDPEPEPDPLAVLPVRIGDVVQAGEETRWPDRGIIVRSDSELLCAVLLSEEEGVQQATVAMAPPKRKLYWLTERTLELPTKPPARIEIDGFLLDRKQLLSVALEAVGAPPPKVGDAGRFALYDGTVGDAAIVLVAGVTKVWYGPRLDPGDFDCLGQGGDNV
jgi:hypothetical protein